MAAAGTLLLAAQAGRNTAFARVHQNSNRRRAAHRLPRQQQP
jgi:hypothetical protein